MEKFTWTQSGLELLANIQRGMIRWDGMMDDNTISPHSCQKPDCYFCNYVAPIHQTAGTFVIQSAMNAHISHSWYSDYEILVIKRNINTKLRHLVPLLPGRTYSSVCHKRCDIKLLLNLRDKV